MTDLGAMLVMDAVSDTKREIAVTMLKDGVGISTVSRYTGLDEATIKRIRAELDDE